MAKVFISSVIVGMEGFRDAAAAAARSLDNEVIRAESFGAVASTPQQACLAGVRGSEVVVLLLGARYGGVHESGVSATHEEYLEAQSTKDILVFVQEGVLHEPRQAEFLEQVRAWARGRLTERFTDSEDLREAVTRSLHRLALSRAIGAADPEEMKARALAFVQAEPRGGDSQLRLVVVGAPRQSVLRPSEIEGDAVCDDLLREASFGSSRFFDTQEGSKRRIDNDSLFIEQRYAAIHVNEEGSLSVTMPVQDPGDREMLALPAIIHEDVEERLLKAIRYAAWVLDRIDATQRISRVVLVAEVIGADYFGWLTRVERSRSSSVPMRMGASPGPVVLSPPDRERAALTVHAQEIASDLTVKLRRRR